MLVEGKLRIDLGSVVWEAFLVNKNAKAEIIGFNKQKLFPYQKLSQERTGIFSNIFNCQGAIILAT